MPEGNQRKIGTQSGREQTPGQGPQSRTRKDQQGALCSPFGFEKTNYNVN